MYMGVNASKSDCMSVCASLSIDVCLCCLYIYIWQYVYSRVCMWMCTYMGCTRTCCYVMRGVYVCTSVFVRCFESDQIWITQENTILIPSNRKHGTHSKRYQAIKRRPTSRKYTYFVCIQDNNLCFSQQHFSRKSYDVKKNCLFQDRKLSLHRTMV